MNELLAWLTRIGFERFADQFERNGIDLKLLHDLTSEDLMEIGIERLADRKLLLNEIKQLSINKVAMSEERRLLTVVFCDLEGSVALSTAIDPEELRSALHLYRDTVVRSVTRFHGFIARFLGDGVLAYFGWPHTGEDQAAQAVRAGLDAVAAVMQLKFEGGVVPHCRVGIATGRVVVGGNVDPDSAFGETPNLAARLQGLAARNQVIIDRVTRNMIGNGFELVQLAEANLKGFDAPVSAWNVVGERKHIDRFEARHSSALQFVGRSAEMQALLDLWRSVDSRIGCNVVVHGEAGIGKSRLLNEFIARITASNPRIIRIQCSPNHVNSAFYPVIGHLRRMVGLGSDDEPLAVKRDKIAQLLARSKVDEAGAVDVIAGLLSIEHEDTRPTQIALKQRRQAAIAILARAVLRISEDTPVLIAIEDAHWIDPSTKELLAAIAALTRNSAAMLLLTARPTQKFVLDGDARLTEMTLGRLADDEIGAIANGIVGRHRISAADVARIVSRADGVPLFAEEMTSHALDNEGRTANFDLPDTLQASLAARLDLLGSAKEIAQVGSVLGREFRHSELSALADVEAPSLDASLRTLLASGLLLEAESVGEKAYRFKHALVQDVAYESLLKADRRNLHRRFVHEVLSESAKTREPEVVAHHLTEAGLLTEAIAYWKAAGARASATSANTEAIAHFSKGMELVKRLPRDDARDALEFSLLVGLTGPLIAASGYTSDALRECISNALALGQQLVHTPEMYAILYSRWGYLLTSGHMEESRRVAEKFSELAVRQNDQDAMYARYRMLGASCMCLGELDLATEYLDRAISLYDPQRHARLATSYGVDIRVAALCFNSEVLWLKGYADQARENVALALAEAKRSRHLNSISMSLFFCGLVSFLHRDPATVSGSMNELMQLASEQAIGAWPTLGRAMLGWVRTGEANVDEGLTLMSEGVASASQLGVSMFMPFFLCRIAETLLARNREAAAQSHLDDVRALMARTGEVNYAGEVHRLRAELHARRIEVDSAHAQFAQALEVARAQKARAVELRAATSYARFLGEQGQVRNGLRTLESTVDWFHEGSPGPDLRDAQAVLGQLRALLAKQDASASPAR